MSLRSLGLWAAALFWLAFAQPVAAQSLSTLSLKDAAGATQSECVYSDGARLYPCHLTFGWTGSAAKAWTVDASGYGGVNVFSSVLPTGAATSAKQDSLLAALGTPLQAGGAVTVQSAVNLATGQGSVTTTSASLVAARSGRRSVTIENTGTTPVYIGSSGVTASTGFLLPGVAGASLTLTFAGAVYAVTASGSAAVSFYETY